MALVSRVCFMSSRMCSQGVFLNFYNSPLQYSCSYNVLRCLPMKTSVSHLYRRLQSSDAGKHQPTTSTGKQSQTARLKQAVRDYGATIIVFHVALSLTSLGICYIAISNGVDAVSLLKHIGFSESLLSTQIAVGGSTFVMAYAVHKLFAPARIAVTLSAAPFIVRYLRKMYLIKPPIQKR